MNNRAKQRMNIYGRGGGGGGVIYEFIVGEGSPSLFGFLSLCTLWLYLIFLSLFSFCRHSEA